MQNAEGVFQFKRWDESAYSEPDGGPKLTEARVSNDFRGDIEGSSDLVYVMTYLTDDSGTFVGYEQVTGRLGDRSGSFVLQHIGTYEGGTVKDTVTVVPGSATGALSGLRGSGSCGGDGEAVFTLDYELA